MTEAERELLLSVARVLEAENHINGHLAFAETINRAIRQVEAEATKQEHDGDWTR
ncbi:MAG TPA: hypothetical protein VGC09_00395 [Rhodopila sp.]